MLLSVSFTEHLAQALDYPDEHSAGHAQGAAALLEGRGREHDVAAARLRALSAFIAADVLVAEERYTKLFDLKPVCTLDLGWHIFGDNYDRGMLLAGLVGELRAHGVDQRHELPDHLCTLLRLLARQERADQEVLCHSVLVPALGKVVKALERSSDHWTPVLAALPDLLAHELPVEPATVLLPRRSLEVLPC